MVMPHCTKMISVRGFAEASRDAHNFHTKTIVNIATVSQISFRRSSATVPTGAATLALQQWVVFLFYAFITGAAKCPWGPSHPVAVGSCTL